MSSDKPQNGKKGYNLKHNNDTNREQGGRKNINNSNFINSMKNPDVWRQQ